MENERFAMVVIVCGVILWVAFTLALFGCATSVNFNFAGNQETHYISPDGVESKIGTAEGNTANVDVDKEKEVVIGKKEVNEGQAIPEKKGFLRKVLGLIF
jgi:hypothetical protein